MSLLNSSTSSTTTTTTITLFLCSLTFYSLLQTHFAAASLAFFCSTSGNFTTNDSFDKNSNELLGYFNYEINRNDFADQALGYAHCNYGVSASDCQRCIADAGNEILQNFPYSKEAVMINENCVLKHSNMSFFGQVEDHQISLVIPGERNSSSPAEIDGKRLQLLKSMADEVSRTPRLVSTGDSPVDQSTKLYGLAQCTRDLSNYECKKCLDGAISQIQTRCSGNMGARALAESCSLRYEVYQFYPNEQV